MTQQYMLQQHHQQQQQQQQQQHRQPQQQQQQQRQPQQQASRRPKLGSVSLYEDSTERRRMSELADLFAIIKVGRKLWWRGGGM
jgi:hypothetical protein